MHMITGGPDCWLPVMVYGCQSPVTAYQFLELRCNVLKPTCRWIDCSRCLQTRGSTSSQWLFRLAADVCCLQTLQYNAQLVSKDGEYCKNTIFSHASNFHDFRDLSRIVKLNTREFLEYAHHHNFICIEYQHLENTQN